MATTLLLLCGSLRQGSVNHAVLATVAAEAPAGVDTVSYGGTARLPHFNPDDDGEDLDAEVAALRAAIGAADAVMICTPEYAGALPGSFKNLLDWTVGGGEMDRRPVAWINASGIHAPTGGAGAHDSLRGVLGYVGADIVEAAVARVPVARDAVGEDGTVAAPPERAAIAAAAAALAAHAPATG